MTLVVVVILFLIVLSILRRQNIATGDPKFQFIVFFKSISISFQKIPSRFWRPLLGFSSFSCQVIMVEF